MLWCEKHNPNRLEQLEELHELVCNHLRNLAVTEELPHLLVYGPSGSGKKSLIRGFISEIYGYESVEKTRLEVLGCSTPSNKKLELSFLASNHHFEITPSDLGIYDRIVVQEFIKEIAQTQQIDLNSKRRFKVVIIHDADNLSRDAQAGLRRTMEKYTQTLRIILVAQGIGKLIAPLRSRCLHIRVASPTDSQMTKILNRVAEIENFPVQTTLLSKVVQESGKSIRKALLILETLHSQNVTAEGANAAKLMKADWESFIAETAQMILLEQTPNQLLTVRGRLYELLARCISPTTILKSLVKELAKRIDASAQPMLIEQAAIYEHRLICGQKAIFHLEAFVARFMANYRTLLIEMLS